MRRVYSLTGHLRFCSRLMMIIRYWEETNILAVNDMKEELSWSLAMGLV